MKKHLAAALVCGAVTVGFGGSAIAGEWAPGNGGKLTPVWGEDGVAKSECAFSGRDESDLTEDHYGGPEDDGLWASTPAKGNVQSPGQAMLAGIAPAGTPGSTCRGN